MTDSVTSFPVPVVRLIILNGEGNVLILKRHKSEYAEGSWCLPGGKVDYGDTVEGTVAKELHEETSLKCSSSNFLFYQDSLPPEEGKMHCINLYFECAVTGTIELNEESSEYAWIGPPDLARFKIVFRNDEALAHYWDSAG